MSNKKTIAVYAIALNEEKSAERWLKSANEADFIIVGDTGSTDKTKQILIDGGASVYDIKIKPFRFDSARNAVLSLVPDVDICVSLDLDEFFEPGWRNHLENAWTDETTRLEYRYACNWDTDPNYIIRAKKIHARYGYVWKRPVHEDIYIQVMR